MLVDLQATPFRLYRVVYSLLQIRLVTDFSQRPGKLTIVENSADSIHFICDPRAYFFEKPMVKFEPISSHKICHSN